MTERGMLTRVSMREAEEIGQRLLDWYEHIKRDLPWRRTRDPYAIWVSEVMLQQTRVETVIPYWNRFMDKYPTIDALAAAPEQEVLKYWEGLGYYSRARNLQKAVREVRDSYQSCVPDQLDEMLSLPGVGSYTAGAVLSIAYDKNVPAVDGNVLRVFSRLFLIEDDIGKPATRKEFEKLATFLIPTGRAASFNQAIMELGATVCIPKYPRCSSCPLQECCRAYQEGVQEQLPVKEKKKPPRPVKMACALIHKQDQILIVRRPDQGLLAGLWEFPTVEIPEGETAEETLDKYCSEGLGMRVSVGPLFAVVQHTFTHLHWDVHAYSCDHESGEEADSENRRWVKIDEVAEFALPVVHQKLTRAMQGLV